MLTIDNIQRSKSTEVGENTTDTDEITELTVAVLLSSISYLNCNFVSALVIKNGCYGAF
ncbi:MAG TPA: hypothetical protein V6D34_03130 [Candidatus Sericytochromatia bacterium]